MKKKVKIVEEKNTNNKTHVICILDRSGSMTSIINDMIGGFNEFIEEQKKLDDECVVSISMFDHEYEEFVSGVDIHDLKPLTKADWQPRGTTALYDAIGKAINDVKNYDAKNPSEKPDKYLVCIVTDGHENSSTEYEQSHIKSLIENQQKEDWAFIYLAANQDGFAVGGSMGIAKGNVFNYTADTIGTQNVNSTLADTVSYYRSASTDDMDKDNLITNSTKK